jgi:phosphoserine aminotransferase
MFENFSVPADLRPSDPRFGCGPSLIPLEHLQNLAATGASYMGTSHRKDGVKNVVREIQEGLRTYFSLPQGYEVILGNGGATMFWDMIGLGLVEKSSAHFTCGEFSEKWYKAHKLIPWITTKQISVDYGRGLEMHEEPGFDLLCTTLNETSTGVQNTQVPQLQNLKTLVAMDATSGAGQILTDIKNVDLYYFSPQKVFASEGGLYVAFLSPKAIERAERLGRDASRFVPESFKWQHAIQNGRGNQTYNTPALATLFLLNQQVKRLNQLGQSAVVAQAQRKAALLYNWAEAKPYLSPFVKDAAHRSTAVATIDVDEKFKVDDITKVLRQQGVAIDIDGYRKLGRNQLRIALFHNIRYDDLDKLTSVISLMIESSQT